MKNLLLITLLFAFTFSCSNQQSTNDESIEDEQINSDCEDKNSAEDFKSFLGVEYGTSELKLESILGPFTGGEYTPDSSAFMYYFKKLDGSPLTVWVNSQSQKVETVFLEILGYDELFQSDLDKAIEYFKIDKCESRFYGMKFNELKNELGEPQSNEVDEKGVRSVAYDSKDYSCSVMFKFYPEQANMCSSISVNWFY